MNFHFAEKSGKTMQLLKSGSKPTKAIKKRKKVEVLGSFTEYKASKSKPAPSQIPSIQQQPPVQMNIDSMLRQPGEMAPNPDEKGKKKK